ncbi:sporulation protein [Siminovitchia sediminis]|uniref:Sporulation protein n=1 Tax=Siminovitchia sediminis TaxID=1274353 RepID=A0ABW4KFW6_9BACI
MLTKSIKITVIAAFLFMFAACSYDSGKEHDESDTALIKTTSPPPIELKEREEDDSVAYQVRKEVLNMDEIYDAAIIEGDKEIIVAYKVKHFQRFRMKKIEKDLTKKLNKKYPEDKFIVSSDYKIFLEAIRLKEDLDDDNLSNDEASKRFKKIIRLKEEMT